MYYIFVSSLNHTHPQCCDFILHQGGETKFGENAKRFFAFVNQTEGTTMFINEGHIKVPVSQFMAMIKNVSDIVEINFGALFAISIEGNVIGVFVFRFAFVGPRTFGFPNPIRSSFYIRSCT